MAELQPAKVQHSEFSRRNHEVFRKKKEQENFSLGDGQNRNTKAGGHRLAAAWRIIGTRPVVDLSETLWGLSPQDSALSSP